MATAQDFNGVTTGYVYDERNRLKGLDLPGTAEDVGYTYTPTGNRQTVADSRGTTTYAYDARERLVSRIDPAGSVNLASGKTIEYGYDDAGNVTEVRTAAGTTVSGYDAQNRLAAVTDTYAYDAFGNLVVSAGGTSNSYLFTGEQLDSNLDQYYLRQRFYDAGTGRFTRRDTFEGRIGEPITLNKYVYGNGNPVKYTDPSGLFSLTEVAAGFSIGDILVGVALTGFVLNNYKPDPLGGFDEDAGPSVPGHTGHGREDLRSGLLERLAGFGEGKRPNIPNTIIDRFNDFQDIVNSVFASIRDKLVPNGQPIGQPGSNSKIREVKGDVDDALDLLADIIKEGGGTYIDITPRGYEGILIRLPNGEIYGVRDKMARSPNTNANIEVNAPLSAPEIDKIKFNP